VWHCPWQRMFYQEYFVPRPQHFLLGMTETTVSSINSLIRRQSLCFFSIADKQEHGCSCRNLPKPGIFTNSLNRHVLYTVILRSPVLWSPSCRQLESVLESARDHHGQRWEMRQAEQSNQEWHQSRGFIGSGGCPNHIGNINKLIL